MLDTRVMDNWRYLFLLFTACALPSLCAKLPLKAWLKLFLFESLSPLPRRTDHSISSLELRLNNNITSNFFLYIFLCVLVWVFIWDGFLNVDSIGQRLYIFYILIDNVKLSCKKSVPIIFLPNIVWVTQKNILTYQKYEAPHSKKMIKQLSFQCDPLKDILSVKVYLPFQKSIL